MARYPLLVLTAAWALLGACASGPVFDPVAMDPPRLDPAAPAFYEGVSVPSGGARLNGVVYVPQGAGPHPALVLLHGAPAIGAVHVAGTQGAAFNVAELIEHEQRVVVARQNLVRRSNPG